MKIFVIKSLPLHGVQKSLTRCMRKHVYRGKQQGISLKPWVYSVQSTCIYHEVVTKSLDKIIRAFNVFTGMKGTKACIWIANYLFSSVFCWSTLGSYNGLQSPLYWCYKRACYSCLCESGPAYQYHVLQVFLVRNPCLPDLPVEDFPKMLNWVEVWGLWGPIHARYSFFFFLIFF